MAEDIGSGVGHRVQLYRNSRGMGQRAVAGLAGISAATLSRIETGKKVLDSRSLAVALAEILKVPVQDLIGLPVPMLADPVTDAAMGKIRSALQAVSLGALDGGTVQSVDQLAARVGAVATAKQQCRHDEVGAALPSLIMDTHAIIEGGRDVREALRLAVQLNHATQAYLHGIGAPADLCWVAGRLGGVTAERLEEPVSLGVAAFGQANGLLGWGQFALAKKVLTDAPVSAGQDAQLAGMITLTNSLLASATGDHSGACAALEDAASLAQRTGEGNAHWMSFGPTNVSVWRVSNSLEARDHPRAAELSSEIDPQRIVAPTRRANYWVNHARAISQLRGRQDEAVMALRRAELISPDKVYRNQIGRDLLAELNPKVKNKAVSRELRMMLQRAGLPV